MQKGRIIQLISLSLVLSDHYGYIAHTLVSSLQFAFCHSCTISIIGLNSRFTISFEFMEFNAELLSLFYAYIMLCIFETIQDLL